MKFKCIFCEKIFEREKPRKTCSAECLRNFNSKNMKAVSANRSPDVFKKSGFSRIKPHLRIPRKCGNPLCDNMLKPRKGKGYTRERTKYCSFKCLHKSNHIRIMGSIEEYYARIDNLHKSNEFYIIPENVPDGDYDIFDGDIWYEA